MGVYIPNMNKPNNCYDCKVEREADCHIWQGIDSASNYTDRRYGLCPLIEIVTCGECKHWYNDADCGMACEFTNMGQPINGFCNWGERSE